MFIISSYLVELIHENSEAFNSGVLSHSIQVYLCQEARCYENISIATLLSQVEFKALCLDPRDNICICQLGNLAFIFTYLDLVWFQITEKQRDRKYERKVKSHRSQSQKFQYTSNLSPGKRRERMGQKQCKEKC